VTLLQRSVLFVVALGAGAASAVEEDPVVIERVVAVVDNAIVLSSEVESILESLMKQSPLPDGIDKEAAIKQRREQILDTLIAEKLLDAEVKKLRIDVTDAEVERVLLATKTENHLTDEQLQMALGRQGMTLGEYKEQLKKQLTKMKIVQLKVKSRVNVSDTDVLTAKKQQEKAAAALGFTRVRARHILWLVPQNAPAAEVEAQKQQALAARGRIEAGASFSDVAAAESEDPGSKARGGELGTFGRGEMVPEFERAAFAAPVGRVVGPVRTQFGWHLILVDEQVQEAGTGDPEKALDKLRDELFQKELETQFKQYMEDLKREAFIEKRL
jgi:peptidyl-prolyl cis-trans isomerase SurA